jgi:hypothetical protein
MQLRKRNSQNNNKNSEKRTGHPCAGPNPNPRSRDVIHVLLTAAAPIDGCRCFTIKKKF